jgi:hypothetical protein
MRRKQPRSVQKPNAALGNIRDILTPVQLATIGAISFTFNNTESLIDDVFGIVTGLSGKCLDEIIARVGKCEIKIEIIKLCMQRMNISKLCYGYIVELLGKGIFRMLQQYRDGVIHSRIVDSPTEEIGFFVSRHADIENILLNQTALDALFTHLSSLQEGLGYIIRLLATIKELEKIANDGPKIALLEAAISDHSAKFRHYMKDRRSLPLIPELPSESQLRELETRLLRERQAAIMGWWQDDTQPPQMPRRGAWMSATDISEPILPLPKKPKR